MLRGGEGVGVEMVGEDIEGGGRCTETSTEMGEDAEREGEGTAITIKLWTTFKNQVTNYLLRNTIKYT